MNRKVLKVVSILATIAMVAMMLSTSVFAIGEVSTNVSYDSFYSNDTGTASVFQGFLGTLINLIQIVGMAIAVIMLVAMAIKYVSAAPAEKAEIKKSVTIYIVGAVVLFAASGILQVIKNFATANINNVVSSGKVLLDTAKIYLG